MKDYPKILFIADEIPQSINAGSIQFFRLLQDYPIEQLKIMGRVPTKDAKTLNCEYHTLEFNLLDRIRTSRFSSNLTNLQSLGLFLPSLPKPLEKIADEFKPDIVISLMQLISFYFPAYQYATSRKIPLVLFCHDDVEDFAKPHQFFRNQLTRLNAKIYKSAKKRICISPEMAEAWEKKYKVRGEYLYPIASNSLVPRKLENSTSLVHKNLLTIGYAGSLSYGYKEGILEILPVLEKTNSTLRIYRDNDNHLLNSPAIEFAGYAPTPEETWKKIIEECDVVILPYSNEKRFENLYRTHFPSKLSEYSLLNLPIIVYGPEYANGVIWGKKHKDSIIIASKNSLDKELSKLFNDPIHRFNLCKALNTISDFKNTNKFYNLLQSI